MPHARSRSNGQTGPAWSGAKARQLLCEMESSPARTFPSPSFHPPPHSKSPSTVQLKPISTNLPSPSFHPPPHSNSPSTVQLKPISSNLQLKPISSNLKPTASAGQGTFMTHLPTQSHPGRSALGHAHPTNQSINWTHPVSTPRGQRIRHAISLPLLPLSELAWVEAHHDHKVGAADTAVTIRVQLFKHLRDDGDGTGIWSLQVLVPRSAGAHQQRDMQPQIFFLCFAFLSPGRRHLG